MGDSRILFPHLKQASPFLNKAFFRKQFWQFLFCRFLKSGCSRIMLILVSFICRALGTSGLNVVLPENIRKTFSSSICNQLTSINEKQKQLCREYPDLLPSIALGAKISIEECKHQFKSSRWNCPINHGSSVFGKILEKGKE